MTIPISLWGYMGIGIGDLGQVFFSSLGMPKGLPRLILGTYDGDLYPIMLYTTKNMLYTTKSTVLHLVVYSIEIL